MSEKPSLYVVEKKEVIILVVLFVLVTVLSFTLGVRYGESVGRKQAREQQQAAQEHQEAPEGGGTLGKSAQSESTTAEEKDEETDEESTPASNHHEAHEPIKEAKEEKGEHKADGKAHEAQVAPAAERESHAPEATAKSSTRAALNPTPEAVDKNSDEYLLNALKEAGVEPPGGKAPKDSKLPEAVKKIKSGKNSASGRLHSGTYVIQVGSHPTRSEADTQVRHLKARKIDAEILPPFKDKQGEWHRVVIGGFKSKREADREAGGLKSKGSIVSFFVWRLP